jgi:hypothetical protein
MVRSTGGTVCGLLFLLSPLAWFHGIVALTYGVEAFFSALVGYLSLLVGVLRQPSLDSGDWLGAGNIRRGEAVFPAPARTAFSSRPVQGRPSGTRRAVSLFWRSRSQHGLFPLLRKRARLLPKWGWILGDE